MPLPGGCAATNRSVPRTASSGRYIVTPSRMKNVRCVRIVPVPRQNIGEILVLKVDRHIRQV